MLRWFLTWLLLLTAPAAADEFHAGARLLCTTNKALVQFTAGGVPSPPFPELSGRLADEFAGASEFADLECDIGGDRRTHMVRIKIGETQPHAWGMCGAGVRHFFSMWIDGRKVFSGRNFLDECGMYSARHLAAVAFWDSTLLLCGAEGGWNEILELMYTDKTPNITCIDVSEIYATSLSRPVDEVEYPPDGTPRREGHTVILNSTNDELCQLLAARKVPREKPSSLLSGVPGLKHRSIQVTTWSAEVDIDNDGLTDTVRYRFDHWRMIDQNIVMVRDGRNRDSAPDPPPQFTREELQGGDALFPHSATVYGALREGDHPANIVMDIFVWKGETFVIMRPYLWVRDISPTWAVYQLQPDHSVREICVLDRVRINY